MELLLSIYGIQVPFFFFFFGTTLPSSIGFSGKSMLTVPNFGSPHDI